MSTNRSRRIDRDAAEQLLGGAVGGPSAGQDASLTGPDGDAAGQVARVLAAAAAPATAAELTGEQAALTAFREARLAPDPVATTAPVRRRSMATAALARAFSTKAVAAVLSATALCGVAVAAGTGNLPSPLGRGAGPERTLANGGATGTSSEHGPGSATPGGSPRPFNGPSAGGSGGGAQGLGPSASPTPGTPSATGRAPQPLSAALVALCHVFGDRTAKGEHPRQLVLDPVFAPLVEAAGGPDKVEGLCGEALGRAGDDARGSAAPQPTHDDRQGAGSGGSSAGGSGAAGGKGNGDGGNGRNGGSGGTAGGNTTNGDGAKPGRTGPTLPASPALPDVRPSGQDRQAAQG
ncbi:hypothetical protein PUR71_28650 [Streptomyces sp. SP17BM10]|uniref:hypothetical protein n=1 Tax=Streptomyces sp. SP17BM10 TaxID=3002530 RepID=UPI002E769718|nr:hypothetical protein [Streptomyces sp. SP17BM10]MEE1786843.1 hypothetical protein [Streptomyces sp. SP17BM10]